MKATASYHSRSDRHARIVTWEIRKGTLESVTADYVKGGWRILPSTRKDAVLLTKGADKDFVAMSIEA